jgi:hypothetical protein
MVNQSVNGGNGHDGVSKDVVPLTKGLIGGDDEASRFIAMGNEFKEDGGFSLRLFDIAEVIYQEEIKAVELSEEGL